LNIKKLKKISWTGLLSLTKQKINKKGGEVLGNRHWEWTKGESKSFLSKMGIGRTWPSKEVAASQV